ncbi:Cu(I)/Ag(I) efflux system protein CusF [Orbus hercynius]|uniref:Cu(I)/Ag(I) efflux system protein CusF n=1 Tax=Orbus hercynius TaxID=593135 RepID=A0A495RD40_9GAMM|nr:copper-binding protein [Orbus hercynius]RKS85271.1 Cu(I)/Ag(I) efflux system protein CusF [Orbus hercynius]
MKFTPIILAATVILGASQAVLAAEMSHDNHQSMATSQTEQLISAQGVVKSLDLANNKVTISHEPIAVLKWPAMTMRFTADNAALIENLKPNDKVSFTFVQQGNVSLLRSIHVTQ